MNPAQLAVELIKKNISDVEVHMTNFPGGGNHEHVGLMIVSDEFEGMNLLSQHKKVMGILKDALKNDIHAVELKTMTKREYKEKYDYGSKPE